MFHFLTSEGVGCRVHANTFAELVQSRSCGDVKEGIHRVNSGGDPFDGQKIGIQMSRYPGTLQSRRGTSRMQCSGRCVSSASLYKARLLAGRYFIKVKSIPF
jgi:hypothetical protein